MKSIKAVHKVMNQEEIFADLHAQEYQHTNQINN